MPELGGMRKWEKDRANHQCACDQDPLRADAVGGKSHEWLQRGEENHVDCQSQHELRAAPTKFFRYRLEYDARKQANAGGKGQDYRDRDDHGPTLAAIQTLRVRGQRSQLLACRPACLHRTSAARACRFGKSLAAGTLPSSLEPGLESVTVYGCRIELCPAVVRVLASLSRARLKPRSNFEPIDSSREELEGTTEWPLSR